MENKEELNRKVKIKRAEEPKPAPVTSFPSMPEVVCQMMQMNYYYLYAMASSYMMNPYGF
jgi:hypothetical protein